MKIKFLALLTFCLTFSTGFTQVVTSKGAEITVAEPEYFGNVIYVKNNQAVELEKQKVFVTVKASASLYLTGIGSVKQKVVINGEASPVKIEEDNNVKFIVKVTDNKYDPFEIVEIYRLKKGGNDRSMLTAETGSFSGTKSGDMVRVKYKATKYGVSSYLVTLPEISMGEYAFSVNLKSNDNSKENASFTLHLFGITKTSLKKDDEIEFVKYSKVWVGKVSEVKDSKLTVTTSDKGEEEEVKIDLESMEVRIVHTSDDNDYSKYTKNVLANGTKPGDKVKWKDGFIFGKGIYLGTKEWKAGVKTTEKGRIIIREIEFSKVKASIEN